MSKLPNQPWPEDTRRSRVKPEKKIKNPYDCFGRKPHIMDFDDKDEYLDRLSKWQLWEEENNQ